MEILCSVEGDGIGTGVEEDEGKKGESGKRWRKIN